MYTCTYPSHGSPKRVNKNCGSKHIHSWEESGKATPLLFNTSEVCMLIPFWIVCNRTLVNVP